MPRVYRTKSQRERFLIRNFVVDALGYNIRLAQWAPEGGREPLPPDGLITLCTDNGEIRVGIEHTAYLNDARAGESSPSARLGGFWRNVQASLVRRISHQPSLRGLHARITLNERNLPTTLSHGHARTLAKDLVAFAKANPLEAHGNNCWRFDEQTPFVNGLVRSIRLYRWTDRPTRVCQASWTCNNVVAGYVGLRIDHVVHANNEKNSKTYDWGNAEHRWLLIVASGETVGYDAGPPEQAVNWRDTDLQAVCGDSQFDRVVFWDYVRGWYKWLKPHRAIESYES